MSRGQVFLIKRALHTCSHTKEEDGRAPVLYKMGSALVTTLTPAVLRGGGGKEFSLWPRAQSCRVVKNSRSRFLCARRRGGGNNNSCRLSLPALRHANKKAGGRLIIPCDYHPPEERDAGWENKPDGSESEKGLKSWMRARQKSAQPSQHTRISLRRRGRARLGSAAPHTDEAINPLLSLYMQKFFVERGRSLDVINWVVGV